MKCKHCGSKMVNLLGNVCIGQNVPMLMFCERE